MIIKPIKWRTVASHCYWLKTHRHIYLKHCQTDKSYPTIDFSVSSKLSCNRNPGNKTKEHKTSSPDRITSHLFQPRVSHSSSKAWNKGGSCPSLPYYKWYSEIYSTSNATLFCHGGGGCWGAVEGERTLAWPIKMDQVGCCEILSWSANS